MAPAYKIHQVTVDAVYKAVRSYMMHRGVPAPQFDDLVKLHAKACSMSLSEARAALIEHLKADLAALMDAKPEGPEGPER